MNFYINYRTTLLSRVKSWTGKKKKWVLRNKRTSEKKIHSENEWMNEYFWNMKNSSILASHMFLRFLHLMTLGYLIILYIDWLSSTGVVNITKNTRSVLKKHENTLKLKYSEQNRELLMLVLPTEHHSHLKKKSFERSQGQFTLH